MYLHYKFNVINSNRSNEVEMINDVGCKIMTHVLRHQPCHVRRTSHCPSPEISSESTHGFLAFH